jgi:hypothetical protein
MSTPKSSFNPELGYPGQYYCQFSQICLKPNKIVTISIGFQGFGNSIARIKGFTGCDGKIVFEEVVIFLV